MIMHMHHQSIIVSSEAGVDFYKKLGFQELSRTCRVYDTIVYLIGYGEQLEIYIDETHPARPTNPEALGLRHIGFQVHNIEFEWRKLEKFHPEPIRFREDGRKAFFVKDPDGLPIEFLE